jgi:hypothetical protein
VIPALLLATALAAPTTAQEQSEPPLRMQAYVARVLEARELPDETPPPRADNVVVIGTGREFEMVFDLASGLFGDPPAGIRKRSFVSEWEPSFPQYEFALIFETQDPRGPFIAEGFPVVKATSGRWVFCIGPGEDRYYNDALRGLGRPVQFASPVHFRHIPREHIAGDAYSAMPEGARSCTRGIYAEELVAVFAEGEPREFLGR